MFFNVGNYRHNFGGKCHFTGKMQTLGELVCVCEDDGLMLGLMLTLTITKITENTQIETYLVVVERWCELWCTFYISHDAKGNTVQGEEWYAEANSGVEL